VIRINNLSRNLLAISFAYPPSAAPRAVQVSRLLNSLHFPTLIISADYKERSIRNDVTLQNDSASSVVQCVRVPFARSDWASFLARASDRFSLPVVNKAPDAYRSWGPHVIDSAVSAAHQGQPFDLLITFGAPMSDHLIGLKLKKRLGLPWLAHFSDPWVDNPFTAADPLTNAVNRSLERKVLSAADRVVFTSDETVDLVFKKYPESWKQKARILPHAFDDSLFGGTRTNESQITIRYLGDFYGPRTPKPLYLAIRQLLESDPALLANVRFELIGNLALHPANDGFVDGIPPEMVSIKPPVGYLESLALMRSSDGLLVIDAPAAQSVFLPSKLIDYIGSERPIFGISPPGTATKLIAELGGWIADPADSANVRNQLAAFIQFLRKVRAGSASWGVADVRKRFEISSVSTMFADIIGELANCR
jgi:Glycosyl transferase 4-like domain